MDDVERAFLQAIMVRGVMVEREASNILLRLQQAGGQLPSHARTASSFQLRAGLCSLHLADPSDVCLGRFL